MSHFSIRVRCNHARDGCNVSHEVVTCFSYGCDQRTNRVIRFGDLHRAIRDDDPWWRFVATLTVYEI
jgi:hypothetical protein